MLTPTQRSESAGKTVMARWNKAKKDGDEIVLKRRGASIKKSRQVGKVQEMSEGDTDAPALDTSKKALHLCLKRIKETTDEAELRRLTDQLQRILFHKQYLNA